jgi:hypothetical protein
LNYDEYFARNLNELENVMLVCSLRHGVVLIIYDTYGGAIIVLSKMILLYSLLLKCRFFLITHFSSLYVCRHRVSLSK